MSRIPGSTPSPAPCPAPTHPGWVGAGGPRTTGAPLVPGTRERGRGGGNGLTREDGVGELGGHLHAPAQPPHADVVPAPGPRLEGGLSCKSPASHPRPPAVPAKGCPGHPAPVPPVPGYRGAACPPAALTAALLVGAVGARLGEVAGQLRADAAPAVAGHLLGRAGASTRPARQRGRRLLWWQNGPGWRAAVRGRGSVVGVIPSSRGPLSPSTSLALRVPQPRPCPALRGRGPRSWRSLPRDAARAGGLGAGDAVSQLRDKDTR